MTLKAITPARGIYNGYKKKAGITGNKPAFVNGEGTFDEGYDLGRDFANEYHKYAKKGVVKGATNKGGVKSVLRQAFNQLAEGGASASNVLHLATAFATYWSGVALIPGPVTKHDLPLAVVGNDAMSLIGAFVGAIQSSLTDRRSNPPWFRLISNVQKVVKKIKWTIIEQKIIMGVPTPQPPFIKKIK